MRIVKCSKIVEIQYQNSCLLIPSIYIKKLFSSKLRKTKSIHHISSWGKPDSSQNNECCQNANIQGSSKSLKERRCTFSFASSLRLLLEKMRTICQEFGSSELFYANPQPELRVHGDIQSQFEFIAAIFTWDISDWIVRFDLPHKIRGLPNTYLTFFYLAC